MDISSKSIFCITIFALILYLQMLYATPDDSISFPDILQSSSSRSRIFIDGDAKPSDSSSMIQLTQPRAMSSGRVTNKEPVDFKAGQGFSTYFSFSVSPENGGNLAFLITPDGNQSDVVVEFNLTKERKQVGINIGRLFSVESRNLSIAYGKNNSNFYSWIDYQASYKTLEVRLSDTNNTKPLTPLVTFPIEFSKMWENTTAVVALASSNKNALQSCSLDSWRFERNVARHWMHSEPADTSKRVANDHLKEKKCLRKFIAALIFGIAWGAAAAFSIICLYSAFRNRRVAVVVAPEECLRFQKGSF